MKLPVFETLITVVVIILLAFYISARKNLAEAQNEIQDLLTEIEIFAQNEIGHQEQLNQKADSISNLATIISNLNEEINLQKQNANYWRVTASQLKLQLEGLQQKEFVEAVSGSDSLGSYLQVEFSGTKNIITYSGYTRAYLAELTSSYYELLIELSTISVSSELFRDTDGIWRIRTVSDTPGVTLTATHQLDETAYRLLHRPTIQYIEPRPYGAAVGMGIGIPTNNLSWDGAFFDLIGELWYRRMSLRYSAFNSQISINYLIRI